MKDGLGEWGEFEGPWGPRVMHQKRCHTVYTSPDSQKQHVEVDDESTLHEQAS